MDRRARGKAARVRYRRHVLWRELTRTRVLVAAFVVVVVVVLVLDRSHQPPGCHFVRHDLVNGAYYETRSCPTTTTAPSAAPR